MQHVNKIDECSRCGKSHKTGVLITNGGFVYSLGYTCLKTVTGGLVKAGKTIDAALLDIKKAEKMRAAKSAE